MKKSEHATLEALGRTMFPEGHGLPGADSVDLAAAVEAAAARWEPQVRAGARWLLRAWEWGPVLSRHRRRFSRLDPDAQSAWLVAATRSRSGARRTHVAALKQLLAVLWASTPGAEDALGYDYRCYRDDEVHGAVRDLDGDPAPRDPGPAPADYHRIGPATVSGAVPISLVDKHDFHALTADQRRLTTICWPDVDDGRRERVDVVVIGSGAGGAVVAAELAEAGLDVLVLEEGSQVDERDFVGPPLERFQRFCRDNGATQAWGNPPIPMPLGRVVGGTTVVNSGTCFRAPSKVLKRWESQFGIEGATDLTRYYAPIEDFLSVRPVPWELLGRNGAIAHKGATALGYSGGPILRNITDCHGCGQCAFGCPTNAKQAMHITYLPRAQRAGARIYSRCRVERIVTESDRATGVEASLLDDQGVRRGTLRVDADQVVVAAGTIHTPLLLKRSGVTDRSRQTAGNLRLHPATGVGGYFRSDVVNWKGTLQSYFIDQFFDSHELMFEATSTVPGVGAGTMPGMGERGMELLGDLSKVASLGFLVSDTSSGRVRSTRSGAPLVTYRLNELDARRIGFGLAVAAEVLLAAGAQRVYTGVPGLEMIRDQAQVQELKGRRVRPAHLRLTAFHPMGTVRMGADPERSVVDPFGRHHGCERLWVADASTFPSCVGVNPQMTIMAFASRTAAAVAAGR